MRVDTNLYRYALNRPTSLTDPTGYFSKDLAWGAVTFNFRNTGIVDLGVVNFEADPVSNTQTVTFGAGAQIGYDSNEDFSIGVGRSIIPYVVGASLSTNLSQDLSGDPNAQVAVNFLVFNFKVTITANQSCPVP